MTGKPDYYGALGIPRKATAADVARAYRVMMRAVHPDTSAFPDPAEPPPDGKAPDIHGIMDAYAVLRDPVRRAAYDRRQQTRPLAPEPEPGGQEDVRFSPDGPPLIIGPVSWSPPRHPSHLPAAERVIQAPAAASSAQRRLPPFLALVLPTRYRSSRTGGEHNGRTEQ